VLFDLAKFAQYISAAFQRSDISEEQHWNEVSSWPADIEKFLEKKKLGPNEKQPREQE